jgi:two-component system sensor histidine kinase HydH
MEIPDGVNINLPLNKCTITCDVQRLEPVFSNLIINAIQSMNNKGEINVRLLDKDEYIIIEIEDSGSGIPEENLEKIFDPLFTTKQTGTGLGLVTCKNIIEQHGGTISVTSPPTIFTIKLPKTTN